MYSGESSYLYAMPSALIAVDTALEIAYLNYAAEMLLGTSMAQATKRKISTIPGFENDIEECCTRVLDGGGKISMFEYKLRLPFNHLDVTLHIVPIFNEQTEEKELKIRQILIVIEKSEGLNRLSGSVWKQETTRAAGIMAAMMAHEVKNPLSGIRGAAQLLKDEVGEEHAALAELICSETDRIRDLLNQVEIFANGAVEHKQNVNIHEVLQYVISIAKNGFASHVFFKEAYDPSLPDVLAHRDLLVQMCLNLVKNAAEALQAHSEPTITITTSYRGGHRMRRRLSVQENEAEQKTEIVTLPIMVTIEDNGKGIPEAIREHLFEPFVSSKEEGRGLGLAVVAKIASDLGIVVELDKEFYSGTRFQIWLPHV